MTDRNEAIKRIRTALKARSGKSWSVTGGKGTGWGWIHVFAPPKRQDGPSYHGHMTEADCQELRELFGLEVLAPHSHVLISPDERDTYVQRAESNA